MSYPARDALSKYEDYDDEYQNSHSIRKEQSAYERKYKETKYKLKLLKNVSYFSDAFLIENSLTAIFNRNSLKLDKRLLA